MPQETNLNVAPYFDDFDPQSNYYKVLFKPGYPVQARELNNLQSILQNQVEDVGNHLFKEGTQVIPGGTTYTSTFYAIQIQEEFLGVPVSLYLDQLIGKNIRGRDSGVTAQVVKYITNGESDRGNYTLYLNYFDSGSDSESSVFADNEVLITDVNINYATTFISAGEGFANTIAESASAKGSAFSLNDGVYFLRGTFVDVTSSVLILDQYSNKPSYRIGIQIQENIVSSDVDPTLTDNAQGFNNYSAPGADRFQIKTTLAKKLLNDFDDSNFVQIALVENGILKNNVNKTDWTQLRQELARRTFDESGNYYVKDFQVSTKESLNDDLGNRGVYTAGQLTASGTEPSDDLALYKITPGKAYVRGYEVETRGTTLIDCPKPRTTNTLEGQSINFGFGPSFELNNVFGSAKIGFNTTNTLSLRDSRVGTAATVAAGDEIGIARIYDFALESGSYDSLVPTSNKWDISLFDVQTHTKITLNEASTLPVPTFIKGSSSGATGFIRYPVSVGTAVTAYNIKGEFFIGENIEFDGVDVNNRYVTDIRSYGTSDIQSVFGIVGTGQTFSADLIPQSGRVIGNANITAADAVTGISTVTSPLVSFVGIATAGNLVRFTSSSSTNIPTLARITENTGTSIQITGVTTVAGVVDGGLPSSDIFVNDMNLVKIKNQKNIKSGNLTTNQTLYSVLEKRNIESVNLSSSSLIVRRQFDDITISASGETNVITTGFTDQVFLPFDEERYILIRSDGSTEVLSQDRMILTNGGQDLQFVGLSGADTGATLITTIRKSNVTSKIKSKSVSNQLIIDKSTLAASGTNVGGANTTLDDGLIYGNYPFGTRVQDSIISLNTTDVIEIYGIFESDTNEDPESPTMTIGSMNGPTNTTNDLIIGETIVGETSGAKAIYLVRNSDTNIGFIYLNGTIFAKDETVTSSQSGVTGIAADILKGSTNVSTEYTFDDGQRDSIYDYSRIVRLSRYDAPTRKLRVYFCKAFYDSTDTGDITTTNSYNSFDYTYDIPQVEGVRTTDVIDGRPRVSNYSVLENSRSPFEFYGRSFDHDQHSSKFVLASDESITLDYSYYLGRVDRIFIDSNSKISVKYGVPSDEPKLPDDTSEAMNIANVFLPPYLYRAEGVRVQSIQHKRYQMRDISKLEQRIKNLEYYSSLSLSETNTLNLFVPDSNGLNRFKSGIFIDNFSTLQPQDSKIGVRNSVDTKSKTLRPSHYTTAINLEIGSNAIAGIGTTTNINQDSRFATVVGEGIRRKGQTVTLDFTDTEYFRQPFATRVESVTPFLIKFWNGSIALEPDVDIWIDVNRMETREVVMEGNFLSTAESLNAEITTNEDGSRIGITPVQWDSWETTGVNVETTITQTQDRWWGWPYYNYWWYWGWWGGWWGGGRNTTTTTSTTTTLDQQRSGSQQTITEQIDTETLGDRIVSREIIHFMRQRNIEFTATKLKPFTQVYPFFDEVDVSKFCCNKLVEIEMISGSFNPGETVAGVMPEFLTATPDQISTLPFARFRLAVAAHKYGPFNNPTDFYTQNPYDRDNLLPETYSETTTILNIDTFSLQDENISQFTGRVRPGMLLFGETTGSEARVTNVRLITDRVGTLIGTFQTPSADDPKNPVFETGTSTFKLTSDSTNSPIEGLATTGAEEPFYSEGSIDNTQETTLSLRNARVETTAEFVEQRQLTDTSTSTTTTYNRRRYWWNWWYDPLAQTFFVDDETGVYLTKVDLFFQAKDNDLPVTIQIRETTIGTPNQTILPFSEVDLDPSKVIISDDGSIATTFEFDSPVYLNGQTEYAIVVMSNSTEYAVWISRLGEVEVQTLGAESGQVLVSTQPTLGSLFKSQNASVWTPSQYEDLKFTLHRAQFNNQGSVSFFNPELPSSLSRISRDAITINSKTSNIGIGTTIQDPELASGNLVIQTGSDASGTLIGLAGSIFSNLSITNAGVGYTPSASSLTYTGVALTAVTGNGINATADIHIVNGVGVAATINLGGIGYRVGDVLAPIQIGSNELGRSMELSVSQISGNNELILENVQGEFDTLNSLTYINNNGITTTMNYAVGGGVVPLSAPRIISDGLHMKIFQRNHGMHSGLNQVTLSDISSDVNPSPLSVDYTKNATSDISIGSTTNFGQFEGVGVGTTNPGYVKIGEELISYTGVAGNSLTGVTRALDNTMTQTHRQSDLVTKYELDGVSLRRINKTHDLSNVTKTNPIGLDFYHVKVDMNDLTIGPDRSSGSVLGARFFARNAKAGGINAKGTYNLPFNLMIPKITTIEPTTTNITFEAKTISETSISGREIAYRDKGFVNVANYQKNYFESPRMIASRVNETKYLTALAGNKSFGLNANLFSSDDRVSPTIDLDNSSIVFTTNRINAPITDYVNDPRVNTVNDDPNNFIYVSKNVTLENPATGLKVYLDSYISVYNDVRVFYALDQVDLNVDELVFVPFPGYTNYDEDGNLILLNPSDGSSDVNIPRYDYTVETPRIDEFREYTYTNEDLPSFMNFRIKIIGTSTNQSIVPQIRNLRAIALA
jgi:hypothetical protein